MRTIDIPPSEYTFENIIVGFHPHPPGDHHASDEDCPVRRQGDPAVDPPRIIAAIQNETLIHHDILFVRSAPDDDDIAIRCGIDGILNGGKIVIRARSDGPLIPPACCPSVRFHRQEQLP